MPWSEESPSQCPNGHPWGDGGCLVGWDNLHKPRACRTWTCKTCGAQLDAFTVYGDSTGPLHFVPERRRRR